MKLLRKPFFAVLLCIIIVLASTALSMDKNLSKKSYEVIDGFYNGVKYQGELRPAIAGQINNLCAVAEDMVGIANNYGINTAALSTATNNMKLALNNNSMDISGVSGVYNDFYASLKAIENEIHAVGLSERHTGLMQEYSGDISEAAAAIANSGYNDSVRQFLQSNDRFPANQIAALFSIQFPAYFQ